MRRGSHKAVSVTAGFDALRGDYDAARETRFSRSLAGVNPMGSNADYHLRSEAHYWRMMERARDFERNNPYIPAGLTRFANNVLMDGPQPDPTTGDEAVNEILKAAWCEWASDPQQCDLAGRLTLHQMAGLRLTSVARDGDCQMLPTRFGSIQYMEAHRLRTPQRMKRNIVLGVQKDEYGKHLAYFFAKEEVNPMHGGIKLADTREIAALDVNGYPQVLHQYDPKRFHQTRGVTALAPCINPMGMLDDAMFAELVKRQVNALLVFIRNRAAESGMDPLPVAAGKQTTESDADVGTRIIEELVAGTMLTGAPGETIQAYTPDSPGASYFEHCLQILTILAINLEMPVMALLLDPRETNFSGWRGAMDQARLGQKKHRNQLNIQFYTPIWKWKLRQFIVADPALRRASERLGSSFFSHRWQWQGWPYIQPLEEAEADETRIASLVNNRRNVQAERGLDIDETDRVRVTDNERLILMALEAKDRILTAWPDADVDWRELIHVSSTKPKVSGGATGTQQQQPQQGARNV